MSQELSVEILKTQLDLANISLKAAALLIKNKEEECAFYKEKAERTMVLCDKYSELYEKLVNSIQQEI